MKQIILAVCLIAGAATLHATTPFQQDTTMHKKSMHNRKMSSDSMNKKSWNKSDTSTMIKKADSSRVK
jgi:hypothetical protein